MWRCYSIVFEKVNMSGKKILITGSSGVIGQALLKELERCHYKNIIAISSENADLRDEKQTLALFKSASPDIVFHLAARVYGIMGNLQNKAAAYTDNIRINTNVIDAAYQAGAKKIIAMGSAAIYSDVTPMPMSEDDIWCGPPHYSEAAYAHAKRAMLAQLEAYKSQCGLDFAFCVSTNLYGPHDKFDENWGHVIPSLISKFYYANKNNTPVSIWGTGKPERDFLFSEDAACALRLIAEKFSGPINLATGNTHTIRETVELLKQITAFQGEITWDSSKPDGQNLRQYHVAKLVDLGFKPSHTLEQGLTKTYQWFTDNIVNART